MTDNNGFYGWLRGNSQRIEELNLAGMMGEDGG